MIQKSLKSKQKQKLKITQVRSLIGCSSSQRATVKALGLRKIGHSVTHEDRPEIRGMIRKVAHLVEVNEVSSK